MPNSKGVVDPTARDKYLLQVTAGPSYDPGTHHQVNVNSREATKIDSDHVTAYLHVRIKDYHGLPPTAPSTSPYFSHKNHTADRYSIAYSFIPKRNLPGSDMVMGFDYSHSVRHQLPPGTKYAMKIATSMLDPGLYSDPYSDEPYLYGPALSSWFAFSVGELVSETGAAEQLRRLESRDSGVVTEGATAPSAAQIRSQHDIPGAWKKRRKHFLSPDALRGFTFEQGRMYHADFFNPHLDFANFALVLPGFRIGVAKYVDEKTHHLRYVLKNRETGEVLLCVFFRLLFGAEMERALREAEGKGEGAAGVMDGAGDRERKEEMASSSDAPQSKPEPEHVMRNTVVDEEEEQEQNQSMTSSVTDAAASLANSIYAVYAALGFTNSSSSSSESGSEDKDDASQSTHDDLHAQIDQMDDAAVERFLQAKNASTA
ncbi:hypothetical protein ACN47E_000648 [Coniothyrium glycines]